MSYHPFERRLAELLDSRPRLRAAARAGYRRVNYLLHGWSAPALRLHAQASLRRIAGGAGDEDCFFGYYGIQPWSRDGRCHLFHRRLAGDAGSVEICAYDLHADSTRVLARSRAWSTQQGTMAQWIGTDAGEAIVFNDIAGRRLVSRVLEPGGRESTVDWPIQALRPGAPEALSLNYRRLARLRPEYGYETDVENFTADQPLESDGLWIVDLRNGTARLAVTLRQLADRALPDGAAGVDHKVNHAVYSPDGRRFVFLHRWFSRHGKFSRLYVAQADGSELRLLLDHRMVSHYAWRDSDTLLAYARTPEHGDDYCLVDVRDGSVEAWSAGDPGRHGDGHPSWSPDGRWVVTDTYPDRARMSHLLLLDSRQDRIIEAGAFHSPWRFDGVARCDLHPRWSPDGRQVSIDSAHEGRRGVYVVDVSRVLAEAA